jgi:adenylate cyclase class 2
MSVEIEKKYRLTEELKHEVVGSLEEFSAEFIREDLEENTLFSNDDLFEKNAIVRIRRTRKKAILTFKRRIASTSDAKRQIEFESEVSDPDAVRSIIESMGLRAAIVYEKRRKTYKFRSVEIVLDELPFGHFMEIEGPLSAIAEAEMLLGIDELEVEHETYPRLAMKYGVKVGDIVESRFEKTEV